MLFSHNRSLRNALASTAALAFCICALAPQARADNKDMIRLQAQVQALADAVARLQQSNDERMGVLRDLVQQTSDAVNKMTLTVGSLKQQMDNNRDGSAKASEQLAGQIQALNDSLDELKARMQRMEKTLTDVQGQQAQMSAVITSGPVGSGGGVGPSGPAPSQPAGPSASTGPQPGGSLPMPDAPAPARTTAGKTPPTAGPSSGALYRTAYSDFMAGKEGLAASEFNDLIKAYPDDNLSGNAYFYLGEMDLRANKPASAVKNYDQTLEKYPNNAKIPAAHLHKAQALAAMRQNDAATRELRALIARFPASPEAAQAKARLASLSAHR